MTLGLRHDSSPPSPLEVEGDAPRTASRSNESHDDLRLGLVSGDRIVSWGRIVSGDRSELLATGDEGGAPGDPVQGYLAHKKTPPPLGPP